MLVAIEYIHAPEEFDFVKEFSSFVDRGIDIEAVLNPSFIVFFTMPRGCVNSSCTGIRRNIISIYHHRIPLDEGMFEGELH